jgi:hypothetical protein
MPHSTDLGRLEVEPAQRYPRCFLQETAGRLGGTLLGGGEVNNSGVQTRLFATSCRIGIGEWPGFCAGCRPGTFGFSRVINATARKRILKYYKEYGGTKPPPPLDHQGINDAFAEKASVIHYFYNGEWLKLPGADWQTTWVRISAHRGRRFRLIVDGISAWSWTAFQTDRGRCFSVIVDDWGCV